MALDLAEVTGAKQASEIKKTQEKSPKIANGLDKDAFMKLFLEQLKNQDPTAPMETEKIITQTAQLTQVEMQEENKKAMKEMVDSMKVMQESNEEFKNFQSTLKETMDKLGEGVDSSIEAAGQMAQSSAFQSVAMVGKIAETDVSGQSTLKETMDKLGEGVDSSIEAAGQMAQSSAFQSVAMVGKIAETDVSGVNYTGEGKVHFSLFFDRPIDTSKGKAVVQIFDESKQLVRTIALDDKNGQQGYLDFAWDGLNDRGEQMDSGSYSVEAEYNLDPKTNHYLTTRVGRGEIQSVLFDKGKPLIRMGELILPLSAALEFYDKDKELVR